MTRRPSRSFGPLACLFAACSSASYAADADREVDAILTKATVDTLGDRERTLLQPVIAPPPPPTPPDAAPAPTVPADAPPSLPGRPPEPFDLRKSLATAVKQNRDFQSRRESLYQTGLSISLTRFQFGPQFASAVNYLWPRSEGGGESHSIGHSITASQVLPTGGDISVSAGLDATWPFGPGSGDPAYATSAGVSLSQPLLRGFGYEIAWEALTQAERQLTYAIRDFELFREDFSIRIAQQFFNLASQKKTLANEDQNYDSAVFDRKKAEALQQVGRNTEQEVFRAKRREIEAKNQLISARESYDRAVDDFKVELGLDTSVAIDIAEEEPPYESVRWTVDSAIAAARHNRLDLMTARMQLQDSERSLRIAENGLLPDLSLTASHGFAGAGNDLGHALPEDWSSSVGLSFEIPLQRKSQRNAFRSAQISHEQAVRGLKLTEERIDQGIRDALRALRSIEERIVLQEQQIEDQRRAVTVMEIRYEQGKVDNRDLLEARQASVDAKNALIRLKAEHFIARLQLLKDMGIFFVDDEGMWR